MKRRQFVTASAAAGVTAATAASSFPRPAIAQGKHRWRMVTTWPKNFPGLGTGANYLAKLITEASEGRLEVEVYGAGELVPAFEAIDAVGSGTAEMGHGAPYYWKGKVRATEFIAVLPFGLTAQELNAWFYFGGGQALADEAYAQLNCKFFPAGNSGVQMGGWFNKEINSLDDLKGLKMRIPGLGGEVMKAAGAVVVNLPGGEIMPALQSGSIDATEWVGPYNDLAFGFYKVAKYYYYPGWHEPGTAIDAFINLDAWNELPKDLQAVVEGACRAANLTMLSEFTAANEDALEVLVKKHGVVVKKFPDEVLTRLGELAGQVIDGIAAEDALARKVLDSILDFRRKALAWTELSELAFAQARMLPFTYAKG